MRITDELREWASVEVPYNYSHKPLAIADRIDDRINDKCERMKCEYEREFEEWKHIQDTYYVKLPVDADGVPIRVGDMVTYEDNTNPKEVMALVPPSVVIVESGPPRFADTCRHYKQPTVEDILRQVIASANNGTHVHGALDTEQIVAEYANKLRLASDK